MRFVVGLMVMFLTALPAFTQEFRWEQTDGTPYGGHINAILATPDGTLYAGTDGGRAYRSDDRGNSWTEVNVGLENRTVISLAVMDAILFAGTEHQWGYGAIISVN